MIHVTKTGVLSIIVIALTAGCAAFNRAVEQSAELVEESTVVKKDVCRDVWYGFWEEPCEPKAAKDIAAESVSREAAHQRLAGELAETREQNRALTDRVSALEKQLADRDRKLASLRQEVADASQLASRLSMAQADLERANARITDLERQQATANAAVRDKGRLAADLAAAQTQIAALQAVAGKTEKRAAELAEARQQVAALEMQVAERDKELAALRGNLSAEMAKLQAAERGLVRALQPEINTGNIAVHLNEDRLVINLASSYLFGTGQDQLNPGSVDALKRVGKILKDYPEYKVAVDGHTDDRRIRGALKKKFPTNQELSVARAANAAQVLRDAGLSTPAVTGYADTQPVASNKTDGGRAKNRRVEIRVTTT